MKRLLKKVEEVEIGSFIDAFVKERQKFFSPDEEWIEAELPEEKQFVWMNKNEMELELDQLVKRSLGSAERFPLKMKITVRPVLEGVKICYEDNGAGTWRNKELLISGNSCKEQAKQRRWGVQMA